MRADHHELPTPRTTLRTGYVRVLVWCKSCRHRRDADLQGLIDAAAATCRWSSCGSAARTAAAGSRISW
jgi:hypothetical protein